MKCIYIYIHVYFLVIYLFEAELANLDKKVVDWHGNYDQVSLGQGQGPKAEKLLSQGMERGMWVCLQNCHLSQSWMPALERIVDMVDPEKVQKNFSSP